MFSEKSTAVLIMELLYQQEAKRWPSVVNPDEIHIDEILAVLEHQAKISFFGDVEKCVTWFLGPSSTLSDHDKSRIVRLMALKVGTREFTSVFAEILSEVQKNPGDNSMR